MTLLFLLRNSDVTVPFPTKAKLNVKPDSADNTFRAKISTVVLPKTKVSSPPSLKER